MDEEIKRVGRELKYQGKLVRFYEDTMQIPNGNTAKWDFIEHQGAAAVVPVTSEGKVLMVRQYRNALDRFTLEIPAGGLNGAQEPTKQAAARELEEETGYHSEELELLLTLRTTVAFCNEKIDIYLARNLQPGKQHLDEDEYIDVYEFTIEQLNEKIFAGEIEDGKTIAAIMAYQCKYLHKME